MTVDEEFNKLDDDLRRLKIEYEVILMADLLALRTIPCIVWKPPSRRYSSDQSKLNFSQRFRFTNLVQKYAVNAQPLAA